MLSEERIAKLDAIGMCWTIREKERRPEYFTAAEDYAKRFGHLCVLCSHTTSDGVELGQWLSFLKTKRKQYGKGQYLTRERIAAVDYYREHGDLKVPVKYVNADGLNLGLWVQSVRKSYRNGFLNRGQIGMLWGGFGQSGKLGSMRSEYAQEN